MKGGHFGWINSSEKAAAKGRASFNNKYTSAFCKKTEKIVSVFSQNLKLTVPESG